MPPRVPLPPLCASTPRQAPYNTKACFLDDHTVVGRFDVTFDGSYGPYLKCNPAPATTDPHWLNMTDWVCAYHGPGPNEWDPGADPAYCAAPCQRANVSVGKDPTMHHFYYPPGKKSVLTYFGGYWYSTPRLGRCAGDHTPGDGSGCTWRVRAAPTFINVTCMADRLFAAVERAGPACFRGCGGGGGSKGRADPCYVRCVRATVLAGISVVSMVKVWESAFAAVARGGCPRAAVAS